MLAEERSEKGVRCVEVMPLIEAVPVLATGQAQGDAVSGADELRRSEDYRQSQYSTLTLDVTPEKAQHIAAALRIGELIPVLRGDGDLATSNLPTLSAGLPECAQPVMTADSQQLPAKPVTRVELWVGGQAPPVRSVHEFAAVETPSASPTRQQP
jgi:hypothetical protein